MHFLFLLEMNHMFPAILFKIHCARVILYCTAAVDYYWWALIHKLNSVQNKISEQKCLSRIHCIVGEESDAVTQWMRKVTACEESDALL